MTDFKISNVFTCIFNWLVTRIVGLTSFILLFYSTFFNFDFQNIPPGVGLLRQLKTFNADENYIEELPEEVCVIFCYQLFLPFPLNIFSIYWGDYQCN